MIKNSFFVNPVRELRPLTRISHQHPTAMMQVPRWLRYAPSGFLDVAPRVRLRIPRSHALPSKRLHHLVTNADEKPGLTVCAEACFKPPSAQDSVCHRLKSMAFSNGVKLIDSGRNLAKAFTLLELLISIALVIILWSLISHFTVRVNILRSNMLKNEAMQREVSGIFKYLKYDVENAFSDARGNDHQTILDFPFIDEDGQAQIVYQWEQSILRRMLKKSENDPAITVNVWKNVKDFQLFYRVDDQWIKTLGEDQKMQALYVRIIYDSHNGDGILFQKIIPVWVEKWL